jgi:hypothetical protein
MSDTAAQTAPPQCAEDTDGAINVSVDGPVTPGANVTRRVTYAGEPVPHATVDVNGEVVGTTNSVGQLDVEIPDAEEFEIEIVTDTQSASLEYEAEGSNGIEAPGARRGTGRDGRRR